MYVREYSPYWSWWEISSSNTQMSSLPELNLENYEYLCSIDPLEYESWPLLQYIEYPAAATQYSIAENVLNNYEPPAVTAENGGGYKVMN